MATTSGSSPVSAESASPNENAEQALGLMVEALKLIDASEGAGIAGAHLDLAIHRLQEWLGSEPPK